MKTIEVVAAIIINDDKILCVQRGDNKHDYIAFKWEFPGGKVEHNETKESALIREIKEELNVDIQVEKEFYTVNHTYPDFALIMHSFICNCVNTNIQLSEHIALEWRSGDDLSNLDWAAADIPIVNELQQR